MNKNFLLILPFLWVTLAGWHLNLEEAKQTARKEHKYILLNFSGSDWCGPCIRMEEEIFKSEIFQKMAADELVLLNADFPRMKKNQLSVQQQDENNKTADLYNSKGRFPFTVLMTADGKVLKEWEGFPGNNAEGFTVEIKMILDAEKLKPSK